LFIRAGPELVRQLVGRGFEVFLDLKFHDIPNTVAAACTAAVELGVWMVNVHCSGGPGMMAAARRAVGDGAGRPLLIGVTVLTSLDAADLEAIGCPGQPADAVTRLARLARDQGLDGVVCSALEAPSVRSACGRELCLVTPGVRPAGSPSDDQKRILTPAEAIAAGADYLVIGRPVTRSSEPDAVLRAIALEVAAARPARLDRPDPIDLTRPV
jgi:orotidine-5'-phosphate decarboxylase